MFKKRKATKSPSPKKKQANKSGSKSPIESPPPNLHNETEGKTKLPKKNT